MPSEKDDQLWRTARKRAAFKKNLFSYLIICTFLWVVWWFTTGKDAGFSGYPWPVWVMLGWGIGLAFQYFGAYNGTPNEIAQQEYEKLKKEKGQ